MEAELLFEIQSLRSEIADNKREMSELKNLIRGIQGKQDPKKTKKKTADDFINQLKRGTVKRNLNLK